jgi:NAD(P)-dependent dehydrogenase (short-subunit alcohol dehydrogenase family)
MTRRRGTNGSTGSATATGSRSPATAMKEHAFLASDDAAYITGQVGFVDGGMSVGV